MNKSEKQYLHMSIKFHRVLEPDLVELLEGSSNKSEVIKKALRIMIQKEKAHDNSDNK